MKRCVSILVKSDKIDPYQMSAETQLKSSLKTQSGTVCRNCLRGKTVKNVRFNFGTLYEQMEALERSERRVTSVQQLLKGKFVSTSRLILLQIEVRLAIRYLQRKYQKI